MAERWGGSEVSAREVAKVEVFSLDGLLVFSSPLFRLLEIFATGMAVGECKGVDFNLVSVASGELAAAAVGQRGRGNNGVFLLFSMVWYFGPLFLVGLISPYSPELGLGFKVVSWL